MVARLASASAAVVASSSGCRIPAATHVSHAVASSSRRSLRSPVHASTSRSFATSSTSQFRLRDLTDRLGFFRSAPSDPKKEKKKEEKSLALRLRDNAQAALFGRSREKDLARIRGGMTPEQMRSMREAALRERAVASVDSEGNPLLANDEVDQSEAVQRTTRIMARLEQRQRKRQERKRWGSTLLAEPEHKYSTSRFRISPRKLQMLADQINGKPIDYAILQMQFSSKRAARRIRSALCLARDHAISAKGMQRSRIIVSEAWVGKGRKFKMPDFKGRMRMGIRESLESQLSIVLRHGKTREQEMREQIDKARRHVRSVGTGGVVRTNAPATYTRTAWGY
ncbi:unnamed protein product [Parajaminaea phylloscopi]